MRIECRHPWELPLVGANVAVVIDVLRMTTTAAVLMTRPGCARVEVAATLEDVHELPRPLLLVSELAGASKLGPCVDNSPDCVSRLELGPTPVLVTTNGTLALFAAAAHAERVLLASFRDLHAIARHIAVSRPTSVLLVPVGQVRTQEPCVEDELCGEALAAMLAGDKPDRIAAVARIRADAFIRERLAREPGLAADLELALEQDPDAGVLAFEPRGARLGRIVRGGA